MYDKGERSVTDVKAYWVIPSCKHSLQPCNEQIKYNTGGDKVANRTENDSEAATISKQDDHINILGKFKAKGQEPVASLSLDKFSGDEDIESELLHLYFANMYEKRNENEELDVLLSKFKLETFSITEEECSLVEEVTRKQSSCPYWHKLRLGRITASIFKSVSRANTVSFPASLLKAICYPKKNISTSAIRYGKNNEPRARKNLHKDIKKQHKDLKISTCGLYIDSNKSYYAASPDAIWSCSCCGTMALEIKCPFLLKDGDFGAYLANKSCPNIINGTGMYEMKRDHQYYFQVQLQGYILNKNYGLFYIYSKTKQILFQVLIDINFIESQIKLCDFNFKKHIFPELIGRFYTK